MTLACRQTPVLLLLVFYPQNHRWGALLHHGYDLQAREVPATMMETEQDRAEGGGQQGIFPRVGVAVELGEVPSGNIHSQSHARFQSKGPLP